MLRFSFELTSELRNFNKTVSTVLHVETPNVGMGSRLFLSVFPVAMMCVLELDDARNPIW